MSLYDFALAPWRTSHPSYRDSALAMSPAPEYASSEVLVASVYRFIGLSGSSEGGVPQTGRDFERDLLRHRERNTAPTGATLAADEFHSLLHAVLESPKFPNQSKNRDLQVSPLVPDAATFSGAARTSANSWPAGSLVRRMVWMGSSSEAEAARVWQDLFEALSVDSDDDVFAQWLQKEIAVWREESTAWEFVLPETGDIQGLSSDDIAGRDLPARRFVKDLRAIIDAKDAMTRRQWVSLLEAVMRLATATHVIWVCDVNARLWACLRNSMDATTPHQVSHIQDRLFPQRISYLTYNDRAMPSITDRVSSYLKARIGINAILWGLDETGAGYSGPLSSADDVAQLCTSIWESRAKLRDISIDSQIDEVSERETRTLLCKRGIGANVLEFARYVLGQRQTANPILRGYDQGYVLRKRGAYAASPFVVSLGPVSTLAMVHCALAGTRGPRSVHRLSQHLAEYGLQVDRQDIAQNDLGHQLRMLGLVLDSPDAETGMLLVPPFQTTVSVDSQ